MAAGDTFDQTGHIFTENVVGMRCEIKVRGRYHVHEIKSYLGNGLHTLEDRSFHDSRYELKTVDIHDAVVNQSIRINISKHVLARIVQLLQSRLIAARSMPIAANG